MSWRFESSSGSEARYEQVNDQTRVGKSKISNSNTLVGSIAGWRRAEWRWRCWGFRFSFQKIEPSKALYQSSQPSFLGHKQKIVLLWNKKSVQDRTPTLLETIPRYRYFPSQLKNSARTTVSNFRPRVPLLHPFYQKPTSRSFSNCKSRSSLLEQNQRQSVNFDSTKIWSFKT